MATTRENVLRVRCSDNEYQALRTIAQAKNRTASEHLRELVRQEAKRRGIRAL
jgi:predicted transcriptional regulator